MKTKQMKPATRAQMKKAAGQVVASLAKKGVKPVPIAAHNPKMKAQMLRNANIHPAQKSPAVPEVTPSLEPGSNYQG